MLMFFFVALVAISVYKIKFSTFHSDYMEIPTTSSIKGIFAIIIFLSHLRTYILLPQNFGNRLIIVILNMLGQLMVTMFFFYSGFGIMESYRKKPYYDKVFLKNRVLKLLVHFDIAVLMFLIVNLFTGNTYEWQNYLSCWIGWKALGNSNWFIFVILTLYLITFVSMKVANVQKEKSEVILLAFVSAFSVVLWVVLLLTRGSIWCNTLLCYSVGMLYSLAKNKIDEIVQIKKYIYYVALVCTSIIFIILYQMKNNVVIYSLLACIFVFLVTIITMKVQLNNRILRWLGKYAFSIYILQRLPMILLKHLGFAEHPLFFSVVSMAITLLLAVGYKKCTDLIDKKIFS